MTYGQTPHIDKDAWKLQVSGLATAKTLTWADLMDLPQHEFTADFHCVTRWSKLDVQWQGVKVSDFMKLIEVQPTATYLVQHCYGDYTTNIPLVDFLKPENFFAHTLSEIGRASCRERVLMPV